MHNRNYSSERSVRSDFHVTGKSLPAHVEAERAVLGSLLLNDEHVSVVLELLGAQDFYLPAHQVDQQTACSSHAAI